MIIITLVTGKVTASGKLGLGTRFKLRLAMLIARNLHASKVPYLYVFPQGDARTFKGGLRPCDIMSTWVLQRDPYCITVSVPELQYNLLTREERVAYVHEVAEARNAAILGFVTMLGRKKHRFEAPKSETEMDLDLFPVAGLTDNVVPIRPKR